MRDPFPQHPADSAQPRTPVVLAFRAPEAAAALGISVSQLEALGRKRLVPRVDLGGCVVWPVDALRQFLTERGLAWVQEQTTNTGGAP